MTSPGSATIRTSASSPDLKEIKGTLRETGTDGKEHEVGFILRTHLSDMRLDELQDTGKFESDAPNALVLQFLYPVIMFALIAGLIYFVFIRQLKAAGKGFDDVVRAERIALLSSAATAVRRGWMQPLAEGLQG